MSIRTQIMVIDRDRLVQSIANEEARLSENGYEDGYDKMLTGFQLSHMRKYLDVLNRRIERL